MTTIKWQKKPLAKGDKPEDYEIIGKKHIRIEKTLDMPIPPTHQCYCGELLWEVVRNDRKILETKKGDEHGPGRCLEKRERGEIPLEKIDKGFCSK